MVKILDPNDDEIERLSDVVFTRLNGTEVRKYWPIDVHPESLTMVLFDGKVMRWQDLWRQGYGFTPGAILVACFRLSRCDMYFICVWCSATVIVDGAHPMAFANDKAFDGSLNGYEQRSSEFNNFTWYPELRISENCERMLIVVGLRFVMLHDVEPQHELCTTYGLPYWKMSVPPSQPALPAQAEAHSLPDTAAGAH